MPVTDRFGFLPVKRAIEFDGGRVEPLDDFDDSLAAVQSRLHVDDVIFPPEVSEQVIFPAQRPGASALRPAGLYKLPPSHSLIVTSPQSASSFREADGGFLIHFVGHMLSYRLQFHDWWHDAMVPMHGRRWSHLPPGRESSLLSTAYQIWTTWPEAERLRFTSLLYMHIRSFSYEWDWERFAVRYMIFDGCYRMATTLGIAAESRGHADRFRVMAEAYDLVTDAGLVRGIVEFRNRLFHEVLWDRHSPGTGSRDGFVYADDLWRLNDRLLFGLAGYRGSYLSTPWWTISRFLID